MKKYGYRYKKSYKPKRKSLLKNKFFWLAFLFLVIIAGAFYLVFFLPYLQINEIIILGNQKIKTEDIRNTIAEKIKQKFVFFETKSIFSANLKATNQKILEKYPEISEVKIERAIPNVLIVEIRERKPTGIWHQRDEYFYWDEKGVLFAPLENYFLTGFEKTEEKPVIIVKSEVEKPIIFGKPIMQKENLDKILEINNKLREILKPIVSLSVIPSELSKTDIKEFVISGDEKKLKVEISEDWYILFNLEENIKEELFNLDLTLKEKIPLEERGELEYIDLRFGNRVFFRYKAE